MSILLDIKNIQRNPIRFTIVAFLIAIPMFVVLAMNVFSAGIEKETQSLKENVSNKLQIRAKGALGHANMRYNQDKLLPSSITDEIRKIDHITKVDTYLLAMSPVEKAGHFAIIIGITPGETKRLETHGEVGGPRIIAGRDLRPDDSNKDVGVIGQIYAQEFGITVESFKPTKIILDPSKSSDVIYPVKGEALEVEIVGIFESGYTFGDTQLFIPKETFKKIYLPTSNELSWIFVTVDSTDNIPAVTAELERIVGPSADVFSPKNTAQFVSASGAAITNIATTGTIVAGILSIIVVFFVTLITVRERKREIGTLKAIGASNMHIVGQFLGETITLTLIGSGLALLLFLLAGESLARPVLGQIIETSSITGEISLNSILLLIVLSIGVAIIGSLYSILKIVTLSPVEAMRNE